MKGDYFLDTNILVYCFDGSAPEKSRVANELTRSALETGAGIISWQVVQEFLNAALHRFAVPMTVHQAEDYLFTVLSPLCRVYPSSRLIREALMIHVETRFRFFDALVVASAVEAGVETLYSEDLQDGRRVRGVQIRNPFK